jgi:CheY-like chemotaxis protein
MFSILHADGDSELRDIHADFLASQGFEIHSAAGGVDCVEKLREFNPHLLILDCEIPWGGGAGVLDVMREDPRLRTIPVVLTSAVSSTEALNDIVSPPVVRALAKPYRLAALLKALVATKKTIGHTQQVDTAPSMVGARLGGNGCAVLDAQEVQVAGDRSQTEPIGPKKPHADEVASCLEREIRMRTWGRVKNLRVEYTDGSISIFGRVRSYHAKQLIILAAMNFLAGRGIEVCFEVEVN